MSQEKKCNVCQKRVRTDWYTCKCSVAFVFCANHKYPFAHNCTINKFTENQKQLQDKLILVQKDKLQSRV
jgi:hypothetical protein